MAQKLAKNGRADGSTVQRIAILGGGSAGYLTAIALKTHFPHADVRIIASSAIPIIGVGESTTRTLPLFLFRYLGLDPSKFFSAVRPAIKRGIRFYWNHGRRFDYTFTQNVTGISNGLRHANGFYMTDAQTGVGDLSAMMMASGLALDAREDGQPDLKSDVGFHLQNEQFVQALTDEAINIGVRCIDDRVLEVAHSDTQSGRRVDRLKLERTGWQSADLYVDCSGFTSLLLGKTLKEPFVSFDSSLKTNRALVGGWDRSAGEIFQPFTTAQAMAHGWAWQIEFADRINRGYVFSSDTVSDEEAEREFRRANPRLGDTRVVPFRSGRYARAWVGNVVAIGNAFGFVEPLESTNLAFISEQIAWLVRGLRSMQTGNGGVDTPSEDASGIRSYNDKVAAMWNSGRRFLAMHYGVSGRGDTDFWRWCSEETDLAGGEEILAHYRRRGPSPHWSRTPDLGDDYFGYEGYAAILRGQGVPYARKVDIEPEERTRWLCHIAALKQRAARGFTPENADSLFRSVNFDWSVGLMKEALPWK